MTAIGIVNLTRVWQTGVMKTKTLRYQRHRFPSEIISHAVWSYGQKTHPTLQYLKSVKS